MFTLLKEITMNKLFAALIAGLFATSVYAADAAKPAETAAPAADAATAKEKPATPAKKAHKHVAHKAMPKKADEAAPAK